MRKALGIRRIPLAAIAAFLVSLACFGAQIAAYGALSGAYANTKTFVLAGGGIGPSEAASVLERSGEAADPFPIVLWSQVDGVAANASDPIAAENAEGAGETVLYFTGEIELVFPDAAACPTEPGTYRANALEAEKPSVASGGRTEDAPVRIMDGSAAGEFPVAYTRITTADADADGFPITAETIASSLGVECAELDYGLLSLASFALLLCYPAALAAYAAWHCRPLRKRPAGHPALAAIAYAIPALAAIAATATFASALSRFGSRFPTHWSDFSAWQTAAASLQDGFSRIAFAAEGIPDMRVLLPWVLAVALGLASLACAAVAARKLAYWDARTSAGHGKNRVR